MGLNLFEFQKDFVGEIYGHFKAGHSSVLGVAACGAGKTRMAAQIAADAISRRQRVWFGVHLDVLVAQTYAEFSSAMKLAGIPPQMIGCIHNSYKAQYARPIQIVAQETAANRISRGEIDAQYLPNLTIGDEAHTLYFQTGWQSILEAAKPRFNIGLTATPIRMKDTDTFADKFTALVQAPPRDELVRLGRLAPLEFYEAAEGIKGDGDTEKTLYDTPEAIKEFIKVYAERGGGKAIAFCIDVEHAENVAAGFNRAGFVAEPISHKTPRGRAKDEYPAKKTRAALIKAFDKGDIDILAARDVLSVGFDVKDTMLALLLRPTKSAATHDQQIGRAGRAAPGKEYGLILDFIGNCKRHGYGDKVWDEKEVFALPVEKDEDAINAFAVPCQNCNEMIHAAQIFCPHCGVMQEREAKPPEILARSFDAPLIKTVRPSTLNPDNEAHAQEYFRYLQASAVLKYNSLPGRAWMQLKDHPDWTHWANRIPRGRSLWTLGAIFNAPDSLDRARDYYAFLRMKLDKNEMLSPSDRNRKLWYAIEQEFFSETVALLRADVAANQAIQSPAIAASVAAKVQKIKVVAPPSW